MVAIAMTLVAGAVFAAPPTKTTQPAATRSTTAPPTLADLDNLLTQLQSETWATRRRAADQIELLGEPARPTLERRLKATSDPELTQALQILINKLNEAREYGPTLVTLHLDKAPAHEALEALATQAKVSFTPAPATFWKDTDEPRVTLHCTKEPFWSCFQQIAAQSKMRMTSASYGNPIVLAAADSNLPPAPYAVAGPFLFKVKKVADTRAFEFEGGHDPLDSSGCRVSLFAFAEPKMSQFDWSFDHVDEIVTDTAKRGLRNPNYYSSGGTVGATYPGAITFRDELAGTRITRLLASAKFTLVVKTEKFEVPNVMTARNVKRMVGGYSVQLTEVNKIVEDRYAYTVELARGEHSAAEFRAFHQSLNRWPPRLRDANGKVLNSRGGSTSYDSDKLTMTNEVTRGRNAGNVGDPTTFVWEFPVRLKTLSFPVEFKDLPLP
jgi:hypothetical protein